MNATPVAADGLGEDPGAGLPGAGALHDKALRELAALDMGLDEEDAYHVLANLAASDFVERFVSKKTCELMYVFKPRVGGVVVYVKLILRGDCVVISFHAEERSRR